MQAAGLCRNRSDTESRQGTRALRDHSVWLQGLPCWRCPPPDAGRVHPADRNGLRVASAHDTHRSIPAIRLSAMITEGVPTHPTTFLSSYETMIFAPTCPNQELSSCLSPHDLAKTNRREMATTSSKQTVRPGRLRAQRFVGSVDRHSRSLSRHQSYCLGSEVRELD